MILEVIVELGRRHLDEVVVIYFANEFIKGRWFSIDTSTGIIGIERSRKSNLYIDISTINAIEVLNDE